MTILKRFAGINFCEWDVLNLFLLWNGSTRNLFLDLFLKIFQKYIYFWNKLSRIVKFGFQKGINFCNSQKFSLADLNKFLTII